MFQATRSPRAAARFAQLSHCKKAALILDLATSKFSASPWLVKLGSVKLGPVSDHTHTASLFVLSVRVILPATWPSAKT